MCREICPICAVDLYYRGMYLTDRQFRLKARHALNFELNDSPNLKKKHHSEQTSPSPPKKKKQEMKRARGQLTRRK